MLLKTEELGVNMLQSVQSPTHLSHTTLSQPFRIKCERYIFLKKCARSSLLLILFPHVYIYIYTYNCIMWLYNCRLFNAKFSLYINIKYIPFGLFGFYDMSTIAGYLMSNPFYTYILNIYFVWLYFMAYQPL